MDKKESKYFQTASKMEEALISLLNIKDFEYITVKDICLKAKVNRSTFYLHYLNVNDLLEDIVLNLNKSFISFMGKDKKVVINNNLEDLYLVSDLDSTFETIGYISLSITEVIFILLLPLAILSSPLIILKFKL